MQRQMTIDRELFAYMSALPAEQVREIVYMLEYLDQNALKCQIAVALPRSDMDQENIEYETPHAGRAIQDWRLREVIENIRNKFLIEGGI